jgi:hypothetical protein
MYDDSRKADVEAFSISDRLQLRIEGIYGLSAVAPSLALKTQPSRGGRVWPGAGDAPLPSVD